MFTICSNQRCKVDLRVPDLPVWAAADASAVSLARSDPGRSLERREKSSQALRCQPVERHALARFARAARNAPQRSKNRTAGESFAQLSLPSRRFRRALTVNIALSM